MKTVRDLSVLIVDDEVLGRRAMTEQLVRAGYRAAEAAGGEEALRQLEKAHWDVVVTDLRMPEMDGLQLLEQIRARFPEVEVILMTAYATVETAVKALQQGAVDYLTKPFRFAELELRLARLLELHGYREEVGRLKAQIEGDEARCGIVGESPEVREIIRHIGLFARYEAPVLITGDTGTGKGLVARALHERGSRKRKPFIVVPCGALALTLAESTLFGHERGAFTGATSRQAGAFELADGGTLLLDDLDDLPYELQAKLLRALQEGEIRPLGSERELSVDVRVVATTKIDLELAIERGEFRADLYHRLRSLELTLPALRQRKGDVMLLFRHFLASECGVTDRPIPEIDPEVIQLLEAYAWPGNIRELAHAVESILVLGEGERIGVSDLPERLASAEAAPVRLVLDLRLEGVEAVDFQAVLHTAENRLLAWAMARTQGNQTKAASLLGMARTTFQAKLEAQSGPPSPKEA